MRGAVGIGVPLMADGKETETHLKHRVLKIGNLS